MRNNRPVTDREQAFDASAMLVSITDLKGRINDANPAFVQVSGFTFDELPGKAHDWVRAKLSSVVEQVAAFGRLVATPLQRVAAPANRVASGALDARPPTDRSDRSDEVGQAAREIKALIAQVCAAAESLKEQPTRRVDGVDAFKPLVVR
jgi:HAMP domain-containing protein